MTDPRPSDSALLPCPFCSGKACYYSEHDPDGGGVFYAIRCTKCNARSRQHYVSHGNDCPQFHSEVRADWNRRAAIPVPSDERLTDEKIKELWRWLSMAAMKDLPPHLRNMPMEVAFARALLAAASEPAERKVMEQALEALESCGENDGYIGITQFYDDKLVEAAIAALRTRLSGEKP